MAKLKINLLKMQLKGVGNTPASVNNVRLVPRCRGLQPGSWAVRVRAQSKSVNTKELVKKLDSLQKGQASQLKDGHKQQAHTLKATLESLNKLAK
jgi:hypothetical protein